MTSAASASLTESDILHDDINRDEDMVFPPLEELNLDCILGDIRESLMMTHEAWWFWEFVLILESGVLKQLGQSVMMSDTYNYMVQWK